MVPPAEALGVDLVDILGAGRTRGEPAGLALDLDAAERLIVARRLGPDRAHGIAVKLGHVELLGPERLQRVLLLRRRRDIDALVIGNAEFARQLVEQFTGI